MNLSLLMTLNAFIAAIFGIAFLVVPGQALGLYSVSANAQFRLVAQLFGAALFGFAVLTWVARKATASDARKAIVLALFISDGLGFIISLVGQLQGIPNSLGWLNVVIYLLLSLGFAYFQFIKRSTP